MLFDNSFPLIPDLHILLPFNLESGLGACEHLRDISPSYWVHRCYRRAINVVDVATCVDGPNESGLVDHPIFTVVVDLRNPHEVLAKFD